MFTLFTIGSTKVASVRVGIVSKTIFPEPVNEEIEIVSSTY